MNTPIMYTPNEIITGFLLLCGGVITLSNVTNIIFKLLEWKNKPNTLQDEKIQSCEKRLSEHDEKLKEYDRFFLRDKERLDDFDNSNRVTQRALLALLSHAINGNDNDSLMKAKEDLENYLTNK